MIIVIVQLTIFGLLLILGAFLEYLDWHGRADVLREKHPRVWTMVNSRPARLVFLVAALAFLAKDFRDAVAVAPPPTVKIPAPIAPSIRETARPPATARHNLTGFLQPSDIVPNAQGKIIAPNLPLSFNLFFTNKGTEPIQEVHTYWELAVTEGIPSEDDEQKIVLKKFRGDAQKSYREAIAKGKRGPELGVGDQAWGTVTLRPLQEQEASGLLNGTNRLYLYGWAIWTDAEGFSGKREVCEWLQAPPTKELRVGEMV